MAERGPDVPNHNPAPSAFTRWMMGIIAALVTAGVIALWKQSADLAVVINNTANIKEMVVDHEQRMRRLERLAGRRGEDSTDGTPSRTRFWE